MDALGLLCPLPVLRAEQAMRRLPVGGRLELLADDEAILADFPAWCAGGGHEVLAIATLRGAGGRPAWHLSALKTRP